MAKNKHFKSKKNQLKEIIIRERTENKSGSPEKIHVYGDGRQETLRDGEYVPVKTGTKKKPSLFKLILIAIIIICLGIAVLFASNSVLRERFFVALVGTGVGDDYPVSLVGNNIDVSGFTSKNRGAVTLSNTALVAFNSTGRALFSDVKHSYSKPNLRMKGDYYLVYDCGSTGYMIVDSDGKYTKSNINNTIMAGDVAADGSFVFTTVTENGNSLVEVYAKNGNLKYSYRYEEDYAVGVAFNPDADGCAVSVIKTNLGEASSRIAVLNFDSETPKFEYVYNGCLVSKMYWDDRTIYAVGDTGVAVGRDNGNFTEFSFEGKSLTAEKFENGLLFTSLSSYSHGGSSTLNIYTGMFADDLITVDVPKRVMSITSAQKKVAVLTSGNIYTYTTDTGELLTDTVVPVDIRAITMANSGMVFTLGSKEIDRISLIDSNK